MSAQRWAIGLGLLTATTAAEAYVGPGMGLGVVGALLGLLTAVFLAVAGVIWYPMKRMLRAKRDGAEPSTSARPGAATSRPGTQQPPSR